MLTSCVTAAGAQDTKPPRAPHDAVAEAQEPRVVSHERPEQRRTEHDRSEIFEAQKARPSSPAFLNQHKDGKNSGFDFYRDPLNADTLFQDPEQTMKKEIANKPRVMETQRKLLERRYHLEPKLDPEAKMSRGKPLPWALRPGCEKIFFGKGQCAACHTPPFYLDNKLHDLHLERFLKDEPGDGPIKAFTLRGIKDSPPYFHDGRLLTLEDTVEFFNLVLDVKLNKEEKVALAAFLRAL